jgi:hypothetical protein
MDILSETVTYIGYLPGCVDICTLDSSVQLFFITDNTEKEHLDIHLFTMHNSQSNLSDLLNSFTSIFNDNKNNNPLYKNGSPVSLEDFIKKTLPYLSKWVQCFPADFNLDKAKNPTDFENQFRQLFKQITDSQTIDSKNNDFTTIKQQLQKFQENSSETTS